MRYFVTLDPGHAPVEVEVRELPSGALEVTRDGRLLDVDVLSIGAGLSVRVGGRVIDLTTEGSPPELGAVASGHRSYVRVESERMRAATAAKKVRGTAEKVLRSPMPGRVVKVHVSAGDEIAIGQPLLVVEAMKMENELRAKAAGKVAEVHVAAGEAVEGNAKLVTFA
jgi:biotin carboxyl carrier protein